MSDTKFTIDRVSWHTKTPGNPESREHVIRRFYVLARFLDENGLTRHPIAKKMEDIGDEFEVTSEDLTEVGLELLRRAYQRWLEKADDAPEPDTKILERALSKLGKQ